MLFVELQREWITPASQEEIRFHVAISPLLAPLSSSQMPFGNISPSVESLLCHLISFFCSPDHFSFPAYHPHAVLFSLEHAKHNKGRFFLKPSFRISFVFFCFFKPRQHQEPAAPQALLLCQLMLLPFLFIYFYFILHGHELGTFIKVS